jgi:hypothetical protein
LVSTPEIAKLLFPQKTYGMRLFTVFAIRRVSRTEF